MRSPEPRPAARAARAFLTPARRPPKSSTISLPRGRRFWLAGPLGKVSAVEVGTGPAVLLVHGWEGQPEDFAFLFPVLVEAGFRVVAFDLPAHGASDGVMASIPVCATSLLRIEEITGAPHAVIGHSVGALAVVRAAEMGLAADRLVLIAAPARYECYARTFAAEAGLDNRETEEMIRILEAMNANVRRISIPEIAPRLTQPALFLHSKDDRVVPISDGVESARVWRGARWLEFDGLGHRRILRASVVHEAILKFLSD
jgi:pimeloyl-ACP methyl ester carboxylesterase